MIPGYVCSCLHSSNHEIQNSEGNTASSDSKSESLPDSESFELHDCHNFIDSSLKFFNGLKTKKLNHNFFLVNFYDLQYATIIKPPSISLFV
jgi:hypothetical protein